MRARCAPPSSATKAPVTQHAPHPLPPSQRLRLEGRSGDFPFYNGRPVALSAAQWLLVMAGVVAGFAALIAPLPWPAGVAGTLAPAVLFVALPLAALARVAPHHWRTVFGRVGARELRLMVGFALLNVVISMSIGSLVRSFSDVTNNAAAGQLLAMDTTERLTFFAKTLPQLLGEELITLLPFLALMALLTQRFGLGRRQAVLLAWGVSSLLFGLIHLPTYGWNLVQCIVIIGSARLVLTLPWLLTKNIWVSTGAHILNDWLLFGLGLLGARLAASA